LSVIIGPPSPAGIRTDLTTYGWALSCRLAESSPTFRATPKETGPKWLKWQLSSSLACAVLSTAL
jgi:hypothetical protein